MPLTRLMRSFINARLKLPSDTEAAESVGTTAGTAQVWRCTNPEFKAAEELAFRDQLAYVAERAREATDDALHALVESVQAVRGDKADHRTRQQGAKLLLQLTGLLRENVDVGGRGLRIVIEQPGTPGDDNEQQ